MRSWVLAAILILPALAFSKLSKEAEEAKRQAKLFQKKISKDQQIVHALAMWTITLCHSPLLPNMQPEDTSLTMIERITTAMGDLDSVDSI